MLITYKSYCERKRADVVMKLYHLVYPRAGIMLVKIDDDVTALEYGIEDTPELVYFENEIPHLYSSKLYFNYKICKIRNL